MDFLMGQSILYTSKRYEQIYIYFKDEYDIKYHELFCLCAALGFKYNIIEDVEEKGREFRSNYLNAYQKSIMYSVILNDPELGKNLESFSDEGFVLKARKKLEQYAEGGMKKLVEEVFKTKFNSSGLDKTYDYYDVDIITFIYNENQQVPF